MASMTGESGPVVGRLQVRLVCVCEVGVQAGKLPGVGGQLGSVLMGSPGQDSNGWSLWLMESGTVSLLLEP